MRLLLAASAITVLVAAPALGQSSSSSAGDKSKSLDALHSEAMIEQAKSGYADAPVEERTVQTQQSAAA